MQTHIRQHEVRKTAMPITGWSPGDWVVYRKQKRSRSPGPRAKQVSPAPAGETYSYVVDKYWVVANVIDDRELRLTTRRGKEHIVSVDDHRLRRANWLERWLMAGRFRAAQVAADRAQANQAASPPIHTHPTDVPPVERSGDQ